MPSYENVCDYAIYSSEMLLDMVMLHQSKARKCSILEHLSL